MARMALELAWKAAAAVPVKSVPVVVALRVAAAPVKPVPVAERTAA